MTPVFFFLFNMKEKKLAMDLQRKHKKTFLRKSLYQIKLDAI